MADNNQQANSQPLQLNISPRRPSLTQRLVGSGREWMSGFYAGQNSEDQVYGHGFNDPVDDFVPGSILSNQESRRRRNSSISSEESVDLSALKERRGSITERVAGMQLNRKPKSKLEAFAVGISTVVDDQ